eukprot:PhF_6_TR42690/c0_g1_i5/m.64411
MPSIQLHWRHDAATISVESHADPLGSWEVNEKYFFDQITRHDGQRGDDGPLLLGNFYYVDGDGDTVVISSDSEWKEFWHQHATSSSSSLVSLYYCPAPKALVSEMSSKDKATSAKTKPKKKKGTGWKLTILRALLIIAALMFLFGVIANVKRLNKRNKSRHSSSLPKSQPLPPYRSRATPPPTPTPPPPPKTQQHTPTHSPVTMLDHLNTIMREDTHTQHHKSPSMRSFVVVTGVHMPTSIEYAMGLSSINRVDCIVQDTVAPCQLSPSLQEYVLPAIVLKVPSHNYKVPDAFLLEIILQAFVETPSLDLKPYEKLLHNEIRSASVVVFEDLLPRLPFRTLHNSITTIHDIQQHASKKGTKKETSHVFVTSATSIQKNRNKLKKSMVVLVGVQPWLVRILVERKFSNVEFSRL